jgi:hypothetical protein
MLKLCDELEIDRLSREISQFVRINDRPHLIATMNRCLPERISTTALEAELREHFFDYLDEEEGALLTLPIQVLHRVAAVPPNASDAMIQSLFSFCHRALANYGTIGSILLRSLE